MKLTKTASGKTTLKISKKEWKDIGIKQGWMKKAKWDTETKTPESEKGKWKGYSKEELTSKLNKAKERNKKRREKGEKADPKDTELIRELQFALRAKTGWGKVSGSKDKIVEAKEQDDNEEAYQTFSFGTTPENVIKEKVMSQAPSGYSMTIRNQDEWAVIAKAVNQGIDSHLGGFTRSQFDNKTGKCLIHPEEMNIFLRRLLDDGEEEALGLRTDILSTLGIEEV